MTATELKQAVSDTGKRAAEYVRSIPEPPPGSTTPYIPQTNTVKLSVEKMQTPASVQADNQG